MTPAYLNNMKSVLYLYNHVGCNRLLSVRSTSLSRWRTRGPSTSSFTSCPTSSWRPSKTANRRSSWTTSRCAGAACHSLQFGLFCTAQYHKFTNLRLGFKICTRATSLTFDLSHRISKNSQGIKKKKCHGSSQIQWALMIHEVTKTPGRKQSE